MQVRIFKRSEGSYVVFVPRGYCDCAINLDRIAKVVDAPQGSAWIILDELEVDCTEPREIDLIEV